VLAATAGEASSDIAARMQVSRHTVGEWRRRFLQGSHISDLVPSMVDESIFLACLVLSHSAIRSGRCGGAHGPADLDERDGLLAGLAAPDGDG
jgi:transposase-like protein